MNILQDIRSNKGNFKGQLTALLFRIMQLICKRKITMIVCLPYVVFYKLFVEWFLNIELPYYSKVGEGLRIYHGHSIVINHDTIIGKNCIIRQCITIGNKLLADGSNSKSPELGDNVEVGANVCIIGPVVIGDNVVIGAGSVVVKSISGNSVVAGNPARVIKSLVL